MRHAANRLKAQAIILGIFVALIWLLEIIDIVLFHQGMNALGIWPRHAAGLWGILFMPFLHGGLGHVAANTVPFIILGWLVMLRSFNDFAAVTLLTMLLTGLGLWLFGAARAVYIGSSGLIFGYFGFLLLRGYFERSPQSIGVALIVTLLYGGLLWGVLPQQPGISWEAHLFGFLSGVLAASLLSNRPRGADR